MLTKLIDVSSYYREEDNQVTIIDFDSAKHGLVKQASVDPEIKTYISKLTPETGKTYIHVLAMSAGEYYGSNSNSDWYGEDNLISSHKTFETTPAHVFMNHINKRPEIAMGKVIFSVYNKLMHRVEIICELWNDKSQEIIQAINSGKWPRTSMACRTAFDKCSICGNIAHTRNEYCEHLSDDLGRMYPSGEKVMAMNVAPLKLFDISIISNKQADPTSSVLQKIASTQTVQSSIDAATEAGLDEVYADDNFDGTEKRAALKKLSEFIKEIQGDVVQYSDNLDSILNRVKDPEDRALDVLRNYPLNEVFSTMAHLGVSPSLAFLAELISRKVMGKEGEGMGSLAASYISSIGPEQIPISDKDFGEITPPSLGVQACLNPYLPGASILPQYVEDRAAITKQAFANNEFVQGTNVGYSGNGPYIEPTVYEKFREQNLVPNENNKSNLLHILNTIMAVGGAALAAKWYITRTIEQKMKEQEALQEQEVFTRSNGVKIRLVKSASDYKLTYKLAKAAMIKLVQKKKID